MKSDSLITPSHGSPNRNSSVRWARYSSFLVSGLNVGLVTPATSRATRGLNHVLRVASAAALGSSTL